MSMSTSTVVAARSRKVSPRWRAGVLAVLAACFAALLAITPGTANAAPDAGNNAEKVSSGRAEIQAGGSIMIEAEDAQGTEVLTTLRIRGGYFDYGTATGEIELLYRNAEGQTTIQAYPVEWVEKWGPNIEFGIDLPFLGPNNENRSAYFETEVPGLQWDMGYYHGGLLAPGSHAGLSQVEAEVTMMQVK